MLPQFTLLSTNISTQNIYKKALVLSSDERSRSSGDIVNMMSVDAVRLQDLCTYGLIAISGPLQVRRCMFNEAMRMCEADFRLLDYFGFRITLQSLRMGCFRWSGNHGRVHSTQHTHCSSTQKYAREADGKSRQTH